MDNIVSRRTFLAGAGAALASYLIPVPGMAGPESIGEDPEGVADAVAVANSTDLGKLPAIKVGLVRATNVKYMTKRAIDLAGGFPGLNQGKFVLIKPNVNSNDPHPGTTNPKVLAAVIEKVKAQCHCSGKMS